MLGPTDLPLAVTGDRCLILVDMPKKLTAGGLEIPDVAQLRMFSGKLLDAGLSARDKLHDNGIHVGDAVQFGKFAGVIEEWDHIIEGDHTLPDDAYDWAFYKHETGESRKYKCNKTGAIRAIDPLVVLNVDDILGSVDLAARRRQGTAAYKRGVTSTGKTQHYIERSE